MSEKILVSVRDAANMIGVSVRTIHRYAKLGVLHTVPVGRRKLVKKADLIKFAENGLSLERLREVKAGVSGK